MSWVREVLPSEERLARDCPLLMKRLKKLKFELKFEERFELERLISAIRGEAQCTHCIEIEQLQADVKYLQAQIDEKENK